MPLCKNSPVDVIHCGDALEVLKQYPDGFFQMCVTSPPYFNARDYGVDGQIGLENNPSEYVSKLVQIFDEVRRVTKDNGTLWLNLGDNYAKEDYDVADKGCLIGIPWRVALALGTTWRLRQDIIWVKGSPMPESVKNRFTKSHEYIFMFSKSDKYLFNQQKEPCSESNIKDFMRRKTLNNKGKGKGSYEEARPDLCRSRADYMPKDFMRNKRDVWTVTHQPYKGAHFAVFPPNLIRPCILAGSNPGDVVLDPFIGSGTTAAVCKELGRRYVGVDLNPEYVKMAQKRVDNTHFVKEA